MPGMRYRIARLEGCQRILLGSGVPGTDRGREDRVRILYRHTLWYFAVAGHYAVTSTSMVPAASVTVLARGVSVIVAVLPDLATDTAQGCEGVTCSP